MKELFTKSDVFSKSHPVMVTTEFFDHDGEFVTDDINAQGDMDIGDILDIIGNDFEVDFRKKRVVKVMEDGDSQIVVQYLHDNVDDEIIEEFLEDMEMAKEHL